MAVTDTAPEMMDLPEDETLPEQAVIVVAVEGEPSADGRVVDAGALSWREPPLTLTVNHDDDMVAGRIDAFARVDSIDGLTVATFPTADSGAGAFVVGLVTFDLGYDATGQLVDDDACGRDAARMVEGGFLLGVSMEVGDEEIEWECTEWDEVEAYCLEYLMHLAAGQIGAVTLCPFQALESSRVIDVESAAMDEAADALNPDAADAALAAAVVVAAAGGPSWWVAPNPFSPHTLVARATSPALNFAGLMRAESQEAPPREWFEDPGLTEPTPLTITADGRVFGHIATWGTCHIGRQDVCITPPHSVTDYAYFQTGEQLCADGSVVPCGVMTMGTGHADLAATPQETVAHYDDTGTQVMHLAAGEDAHGIWNAGALVVRDLTPQALSVVRAAAPSGDWRRIGGNLELVGVLAVNVPGFPVPRPRTLAAGGHQLALVAAAAPTVSGHGCGCGGGCGGSSLAASGMMMERRLLSVEAVVAALGLDVQAIDALAASLR